MIAHTATVILSLAIAASPPSEEIASHREIIVEEPSVTMPTSVTDCGWCGDIWELPSGPETCLYFFNEDECHAWVDGDSEEYERGNDIHGVFSSPYWYGPYRCMVSTHYLCSQEASDAIAAVESAVLDRDMGLFATLLPTVPPGSIELNPQRSALQIFTKCSPDGERVVAVHITLSHSEFSMLAAEMENIATRDVT